MQNFIQKGRIIDVPASVNSGGMTGGMGFLSGHVFGISCDTFAAGVAGELAVEGVFDVAIDSSTPAFGAYAYWDDTNKVVTTTSSSNTKIGYFLSYVAGVTGRVKLNPVAT